MGQESVVYENSVTKFKFPSNTYHVKSHKVIITVSSILT